MSLVSALGFLLAGVILWSGFRRGADAFAPVRVFGFVWAMAFAVTDLKLSRLQHQWPVEAWVQVLAGPFCFLAGLFVIGAITINADRLSIEQIRKTWREARIDRARVYQSAIVLTLLFVLAYVVIYKIAGEIPLFSAKPGLARSRFTMFGIGLFLHNVVIVVFLTVLYAITATGDRGKKGVLILASLLSALAYAATLQRFQLFLTAMLAIVLLYYTTRHIRWSTVSMYLLGSALFFFWVSTLRAGQLINYYLYRTSQMKFPSQLALLTEPYMYMAMNLENLARSIEKVEHFTYGYYTFDFVTALAGLKHWIAEYFALEETPFLVSGYNTYSAFWTFYRDFGVLGVTLLPFAMGIGVALLYRSLRSRPTLHALVFYGMAVFLMAFSFFNSQIGFLWFVYNGVLFALILRYIIRPGSQVVPSFEGGQARAGI